MDNKQFISRLSKRLGRPQREASALVDALSLILRERCGTLETIAVPSFGNFTPVKTDEYVKEDPATGVTMLYPPKISVTFVPATRLRKSLADGKK